MKVYCTGPMSTPYERRYLVEIAAELQQHGFDCLLPWDEMMSTTEARSEAKMAIERRRQQLRGAEAMVAILDGFTVDDEVACEIGLFYALMMNDESKRGILGLLTDWRVAGRHWTAGGKALSPLLLDCIEPKGKVCRDLAQVITQLQSWQS
ncbi:MAG: nucleoside 2-deoxyribosyltransferase [Chloroflexi bacterium]|nr:nucleoside 2-deoxyribosyltransferase [Chloroflexota bacterium]MCL5076362.1 nucleoside 2-deoxyribosyltransferase [Chloroflexota bacterium]